MLDEQTTLIPKNIYSAPLPGLPTNTMLLNILQKPNISQLYLGKKNRMRFVKSNF